jgi:hypothetical protein
MNDDYSNSLEPDPLSQPLALAQSLHPTTQLITRLNSLLSFVCRTTAWEYGESWIPSATHPILELSSAWCLDPNLDIHQSISWTQFHACSKAFVLHPGEGMPGRVWQSHQTEWIDDVSAQSETYFLRNQIAKALNVKTGLGLSAIANSQVLAVVVFFMSKAQPPDPDLIEQTRTAVRNFQP